jgi:hypothetical protein
LLFRVVGAAARRRGGAAARRRGGAAARRHQCARVQQLEEAVFAVTDVRHRNVTYIIRTDIAVQSGACHPLTTRADSDACYIRVAVRSIGMYSLEILVNGTQVTAVTVAVLLLTAERLSHGKYWP